MYQGVFFKKKGPFSLREVLDFCEIKITDSDKVEKKIFDISTIESLKENCITFLNSSKYKNMSINTNAIACITTLSLQKFLPSSCAKIIVKNVLFTVAKVSKLFYPEADIDQIDRSLQSADKLFHKYNEILQQLKVKYINDLYIIKALHSWKKYFSNNYSELNNLLYGQLLSTMNCSQCNYSSVTFDVFNNLSLGISYGISEFKGDIKEGGNTNKLYNFQLSKQINKVFSISSEILFGDLSGSKKSESYLISETQSTEAYDPYDFYEEAGEKFTADFFEFDLITSINLESVLKHYYSKYSDNNRFDFYYNIGLGIISFKSIKRNNESNTYIYGYGYKDLEGEYESAKGFFDRPKARVISYGYSVSYLINSRIKWKLLFLEKIADTDFLDSSLMNQQNDKFRNISLGLEYTF